MNINDYRLILSDLDGTLVEYGCDNISSVLETTIRDLKLNLGVDFTIATGRSWKQTRKIVQQLGVTLPVIVQAGAIIIDPGTELPIRIEPLRPEIQQQLQDIADVTKVDQFCLNECGTYFTTSITTSGGNWLLTNGEACRVINWQNQNFTKVIKHLFVGEELELKQIATKILQQIEPRPNLILWPPDVQTKDWFLEVFDPLASKGQALDWLAVKLKVDLKQVIAFGDGYNDLDLLKMAGLGVAMEAAPADLLAIADAIIPGPAGDGIARFLNGGLDRETKVG